MEIVPLESRRLIGERRRVKPQALGAALAEILPATSAYLREQGLAPASPPVMLYLEHEDGAFSIQGGFFVEGGEVPDSPFRLTVLPGGEAARAVHVGPYEKLGETHAALRTWIREQGRRPRDWRWDVYVDDPGTVAAADLRTEVWWPLHPAT
jgi:effector-binding domain-containing protein